jgi:hypothetical protein
MRKVGEVAMPFISYDEEAMSRASLVARLAKEPEEKIGWGLIRLWNICLRLERDTLERLLVESAFGEGCDRIIDALQAFGLLQEVGNSSFLVVHAAHLVRVDSKAGHVYFIQDTASLAIKIGFTTNINKRRSALQISHAAPLKLLGMLPGSQVDELRLHEQFATLRLTGEWFRPERELLDFITSNAEAGT